MKVTCNTYAKMLAKKNELDKQRFLFLRHEDASQDQLETASLVYNFIGQSVPNSVSNWIQAQEQKSTTDYDLYSTARNTTAVLSRISYCNRFLYT